MSVQTFFISSVQISQSMVLWCADIVSRADIITNADTMHTVK